MSSTLQCEQSTQATTAVLQEPPRQLTRDKAIVGYLLIETGCTLHINKLPSCEVAGPQLCANWEQSIGGDLELCQLALVVQACGCKVAPLPVQQQCVAQALCAADTQ